MRLRHRISLACCAVTVGTSALAFGGSVRWAAIAGAIGGLAAVAPFVPSRRKATSRSALLVLLAVAIALTALQLVPLPAAVADVVAHAKVELVRDHATAWGEPAPDAVMASYDPPATLVELAKLVGYAALAFAAARIAAEREGRRALAAIAVTAAVAVAGVTLAHVLFGAHAVYGVYTPPPGGGLLSPVINANHFASLMTLAVPVALALALGSAGLVRAGWIAAGVTCAAACLASSSRAGAVGLAIALVILAALLGLQRRATGAPRDARRRDVWPAIVIGACIAILVVAVAAHEVVGELSATRIGALAGDPRWKVQEWARAVAMLGEHPWLGTGRGAFEPAFTRWAVVGDTAFSHVENTYLQVAVDWGVPGAVALGGVAVALALGVARRWRQGPLEAAAIASLVALGAHEVVDFSIELPVVAMIAILLVAIAIPAKLDGGTAARGRRALATRAGLLALGLAICVAAATPLGQLAHAAARDDGDPEVAAARHPADFLLVGRAAQALMDRGDPRASAVMARALFLAPHHAGLHRLAASMLLRAGQPDQARAELALAIHDAPDAMLQELLAQAAATFPDPADAAGALPADLADAERVLPYLGGQDAIVFAYTQHLARIAPRSPRAQLLAARAALATDHGDAALAAARDAYELQNTAATTVALAAAQARAGDGPGAIALVRAALAANVATSSADRADLLGTLADLVIASDAPASATATLEELAAVVADRRGRVALHRRRAALQDRLGNANQAAWERAEAARVEAGRDLNRAYPRNNLDVAPVCNLF